MQPRLIRFRDAPRYLGMDRNRFNAQVRRFVTAVRIGRHGVAFDRLAIPREAMDRPGQSRCTA